jgi:hypothetical protein
VPLSIGIVDVKPIFSGREASRGLTQMSVETMQVKDRLEACHLIAESELPSDHVWTQPDTSQSRFTLDRSYDTSEVRNELAVVTLAD